MSSPSRAVTLTSRDGTRIAAVMTRCDARRATLVVCHGIGEHSGRYARFVSRLSEAGISTLSFDLRGHGASAGRRGHVNVFADYLDDLHTALAYLADVAPDEPWFLFGHSMGAVVVTQYLLRCVSPRPIQGLVLASPGFVPAVAVPRYRTLLGACLLPLAPGIRFTMGIRSDQLTSDPDAQRAFDRDPMTYSKVSVRWYTEYRLASQTCLARAAELALPLYVCVGAADSVVAPSGARRFVDSATSSDKTLRVWDGLLHEPLNERAGDDVGRAIVDWLLERASREASR
jgi:alpha-beta hydrolase superfamily lysophospholipase